MDGGHDAGDRHGEVVEEKLGGANGSENARYAHELHGHWVMGHHDLGHQAAETAPNGVLLSGHKSAGLLCCSHDGGDIWR